MTRVRRAAIAISDFVVRYAPTGSDEWARGLRAELDVVESDWSALRWALGSLRVLLRRQLYREPYSWLPTALFLYYYVTQTSSALLSMRKSHGTVLAGDLLICAGWQYWLVFWSSARLRERARPDPADRLATLMYVREGLERKLARYRTIRRWFPQLALSSMCAGYLLRYRAILPGAQVVFPVFAAVGIAVISLDTPGKVRQQIAKLDGRISHTRLTGR
ncbi:MAG TPA: hypothetical protein VJU82_10965 [Acidobacteriaceae bacterium]|nr:hypothetical protein [Acidobacteriaceae bacterium]